MNASLPGFPFFHYHQDQLYLEQVDIAALAAQYGTPLYVYSKAALLHAVSSYQQALAHTPSHLVCYAVKANSSLAILQTLAQAGCGFDIVSGGELQRVLTAGAKANTVVFSGVGKTRAEMHQALKAGIKCFNVESLQELDVLASVAKEAGTQAPVSLRINPDVDAKTHPYISTGLENNKFGIAYKQALAAYQHAASLPDLRIVGIDCHIGSQITEASPYLDTVNRLLALIQQIESHGIHLEHIDLGGGLGITYHDETPPTPTNLYQPLIERLHAHGLQSRELLVEPGRSIVGNAGALITQVLYLKPGAHKNFCIVDAAMNDLARPAMYEAYHEIVELKRHTDLPAAPYDVVGPVCESSDWLGYDRQLRVQAGDFLAVLSAGAYGMTMSSNYNSRTRAAEILVDGKSVHLIRKRETVTDLYAHEQLLP
ncbi:Diaminopimelate decarboxylase [Saezia sanguinis]|uniref:Diaminopimelate decarboxylase n=1 Tax=Saezia sanguinis TaxID=1965230 RepID=A0A433SDX3_9BURK|nr:diaminopimelate decarboxylase [Saezia sanguinis]RUS66938.1 Diaminopimelate decarboxylase [Saezia sanguinis]